jgi:hypothetical protein
LFAAKLRSLLDERGVGLIEDCPTPFAAVVYELAGRRTRVLDRGGVATAIQASCTVPLMFRPVRHEGRLLVDGGGRRPQRRDGAGVRRARAAPRAGVAQPVAGGLGAQGGGG